jgi:predicted nuclease with TOPRIM domain
LTEAREQLQKHEQSEAIINSEFTRYKDQMEAKANEFDAEYQQIFNENSNLAQKLDSLNAELESKTNQVTGLEAEREALSKGF